MLEERIEIGESPHNLILELKRPYGGELGARYTIVKSPFWETPTNTSISLQSFVNSSRTWEEAVRNFPDSIQVKRAYARDTEAITYMGRIWRDMSTNLLHASQYPESVERYFQSVGLDTYGIGGFSWKVNSEDRSKHPLNSIAKELKKIGVGVQIGTSTSGGTFYPQHNIINIGIQSMLSEKYEFSVGVIFHEAIHAIIANLTNFPDNLNPFRTRQKNRQTGLGDYYQEHLNFDEIIAHPSGHVFSALLPEDRFKLEDSSSVRLMDSIIRNCDLTTFVLDQYDFRKTSFDNGNRGSTSAKIILKRELDRYTKRQEVKVVLQNGAETTFALTEEFEKELRDKINEGQEVPLIEFHGTEKTLAEKILSEVRNQINVHKVSAIGARDFILEAHRADPKDNLRKSLDRKIESLQELPGIYKIKPQIKGVLDLCSDLYFRLLEEQ